MKFIVLLFVNVLILPARSFSFVSNGHLGNSRCRYQTRHVRSTKLRLAARDDDKDFWNSQKKLMEDMSNAAEKSLQEEQRELFAKKRISLVNDTAYLGFFIFCILWTTYDNPFVAFSYTIGTLMGLAYAYGLGKLHVRVLPHQPQPLFVPYSVSASLRTYPHRATQGSMWKTLEDRMRWIPSL